VYGGPRAPTIRDAWGDSRGRDLFHQYLAQKGYVVASIDDRASSRLGHRYEATLRHAYGPTALKDHLFGVEQLASMDFIDGERVGIWGWSGGGFSTCFALTHSKRFKVGIAVAPVTDWRLYDSIYTERYMGLPEANVAAYNAASAVKAAKDLSGRLLLVHGTADDNVHLQNTIQMIDALIEAGKPYDLQVYPGKTHSIHGAAARLHLFRAIERYLDDHL
jgi:dipeptidyl-peptidase-4